MDFIKNLVKPRERESYVFLNEIKIRKDGVKKMSDGKFGILGVYNKDDKKYGEFIIVYSVYKKPLLEIVFSEEFTIGYSAFFEKISSMHRI